ncbi:hypothetical protein [Mesorhizobium sp. WSM2561]|uniref:hypothetical protein n=1 Tax=Mesorhizobium sp. WSM2561 TaxID=1040985 RepID=UPI0004885CC1|nr:hypothetical protein [Mesorhizobium sp. WSM2561]
MGKQKASEEFAPDAIARELRKQGASGEPVGAQIFFEDNVDVSALAETAEHVIRDAEASLGKPGSVTVRKIRGFAKSASVSGDPEVIAAVQSSDKVKSVQPNVVRDILPEPRHKKPI